MLAQARPCPVPPLLAHGHARPCPVPRPEPTLPGHCSPMFGALPCSALPCPPLLAHVRCSSLPCPPLLALPRACPARRSGPPQPCPALPCRHTCVQNPARIPLKPMPGKGGRSLRCTSDLPCSALPCPALPCLALLCPALLCPAHLVACCLVACRLLVCCSNQCPTPVARALRRGTPSAKWPLVPLAPCAAPAQPLLLLALAPQPAASSLLALGMPTESSCGCGGVPKTIGPEADMHHAL